MKKQLTSNIFTLNYFEINNTIKSFLIISNTFNLRYRNNFGQDYFSFWCGGVLFLVINSQYYKNCSKVEKLAEEQDQWLTEKLSKHKGQRIIVFQHIPWFLNNIEEDNNYFNLDKNLRQNMLEKLYAAGKEYFFNIRDIIYLNLFYLIVFENNFLFLIRCISYIHWPLS